MLIHRLSIYFSLDEMGLEKRFTFPIELTLQKKLLIFIFIKDKLVFLFFDIQNDLYTFRMLFSEKKLRDTLDPMSSVPFIYMVLYDAGERRKRSLDSETKTFIFRVIDYLAECRKKIEVATIFEYSVSA